MNYNVVAAKTKKWLSRAIRIDLLIESKAEQIQDWRGLANKMTSSYSNSGGGGGVNNRFETYCNKVADAEVELEAERDKLIDIKQEISDVIGKIDNIVLRVLLEQRYLLSKDWVSIMSFMGYTEQYVKQRLHDQALAEVAKLLKIN